MRYEQIIFIIPPFFLLFLKALVRDDIYNPSFFYPFLKAPEMIFCLLLFVIARDDIYNPSCYSILAQAGETLDFRGPFTDQDPSRRHYSGKKYESIREKMAQK